MPDAHDGRPVNVVHSNPVTQQGYIQIPCAVALRVDLSPLAKLVYGYLAHLAWKNNDVEPPRETVAADLNASVKQITAALRELGQASACPDDPDRPPLVESRRRGQGLPNLYVVNDPLPRKADIAFLDEPVRKAISARLERPKRPNPARARRTSSTATTTANGTANAVPAARARNVVYDALADACQIRPQLLDANSPIYDHDLAREVGVAQASIRKKAQGLDDDAIAAEVHLRAEAYRRKWPEIDLTPSALAKHWNRVVDGAGGRLSPDDLERIGEDELARMRGER